MKKEMLTYHKKAGTGLAKRTEEAEIHVSDGISKILSDHVTVTTEPGILQEGKGVSSGTVCFVALCQNVEGEVKRFEQKVNFSEDISIKNAAPDMYMTVKPEVLRWDMRLNGDRILAKADIQMEAFAWEKAEQPFLTEIDEEGVEQKTERKAFMKPGGVLQKNFEIREQAELSRDNPPIYEILRVDGKINPGSMRAINGKAVVQADLDTVILYTDSETMQLCIASVSIPFTEIFEVEDISEEELFLQELKVEDITFSASTDEKGEMRVIDLNVKACFGAERFMPQSETFVVDCFGVGKACETVRDNVSLWAHAGDMNGQMGIKGQIEIGDMPQIGQVYFLEAEPKILSFENEDNRCTVSGNVLVLVHYITDAEEQKLAVLKKEIPFSESFACTGKAEPHCKIRATGMSYTLNGDYVVDIRGNMEFSGVLLREDPVEVIRAISIGPSEKETDFPSVTVCFAQAGEGLWDIAKKYSASVKDIAETNGLNENANIAGKRLIVPRHK